MASSGDGSNGGANGNANGGAGDGLRADPAFLQSVVANTTEGIVTIDAESDVVFANPAVEDLLGYAPTDLVGRSLLAVVPDRLESDHRAGLRQYLETGETHVDWEGVELVARHADGHEVPVVVSFREHEYDDERLFTGVFTDVSERKRRERRLREQNRALEEFADVLAHDLRDPLATARENLDAAREVRDGETLMAVERALDHVDQVIRDTLSRARHGTRDGSTDVLSLGRVFESVWDALETDDATLETPADAWRVDAERDRLERLAENLLRNALEHADPAVTVTVGILDDRDGFYVEDDGPGYPADVLTAGGEPTESAHGRYGLHVVGAVAAEHAWTTEFTESASGGARVEFTDATVLRWAGDRPE